MKSFLTAQLTACPSGPEDSVDYVETVQATTTLNYDGEQFHQNWKTPSVNKDTCYRVTMTLKDNTTLHSFFRLRK